MNNIKARRQKGEIAPDPLEQVIDGDYCIGCGACAAVRASSFNIEMDDGGRYKASRRRETEREEDEGRKRLARVCPFSDRARNENEIGRSLYGDSATFDEHIGYHRVSYAGHVAEGAFRTRGSSGGMGKWILYELMRRDLVDAVIQIGAQEPVPEDPTVYGYAVMETPEEVLGGSKSVYYPVEMSEALAYIQENPGRYAITGIPCFVKAIRLLAEEEPVFKERIAFCVGLICGHLKSKRYADMIAWQFGIEPGTVEAIDFRKKLPGTTAKQKGVAVRGRDEDATKVDIVQNLFGTDYNHGFFQYNACNFCDDVVGETADVSVGDAWLPEYIPDGQGTSIVVVRHPVIHRLIEEAIEAGRLELDAVSADTVAESQSGGFRQRREGLAYRLHLADREDRWRPPKRVEPRKYHISRQRRKIYELRMEMTERSHEAFQRALDAGDFDVFRRAMEPFLETYRELYKPTFWHRIKRGVQRRIQWVKEWWERKMGRIQKSSST